MGSWKVTSLGGYGIKSSPTDKPSTNKKNPHLLYPTIPTLRRDRGCPRQGGSSRRDRISGIRLPDLASVLTVKTIHLHHHDLLIAKEPG